MTSLQTGDQLATSESSFACKSRSVRKSGIFGNGGLSISIGSKNSSNIRHLMKTIAFDCAAHANVQHWADACHARPALARALARP